MPDRRRRQRAGLALSVVALLALLTGAALDGTLVYYRTPAEVTDGDLGRVAAAGTVRVAGTIEAGSLERSGQTVSFVLVEDGRALPVRSLDVPPATLREGTDAVVEGRVGADGVLVADSVLARHSNEYRAEDPAAGGRVGTADR